MFNRVLLLTGVFLVCGLLAAGIFFLAPGEEVFEFDRDYLRLKITPLRREVLPYNSYGLLAVEGGSLFLDNRIAGLLLLRVDLRTFEREEISVMLDSARYVPASTALFVDSQYVYVADHRSLIFRSEWRLNLPARPYLRPGSFYDQQLMSGGAFVLKAFDARAGSDQLEIFPVRGKSVPLLLEKQVDGIFCVDGMVLYNRTLEMVVYVYYYRNQYICADSLLRVLRHGRTIDPISEARIEVGGWRGRGEEVRTFSKPPLRVNYRACTDGAFLYVVSGLRSRSDEGDDFAYAFPVDVYDLNSGRYRGSFMLRSPVLRRKVVNFDFLVLGDSLFSVYDEELFVYRLYGLEERKR